MKREVFNKLYMRGSDVLWDEIDMELARNLSDVHRLKKHDRLMRDKAHEFNSELEKQKNRKCENCKHLKGLKPKLGQTYCNLGIEDLNYDMGVKLDFCCSKWENN